MLAGVALAALLVAACGGRQRVVGSATAPTVPRAPRAPTAPVKRPREGPRAPGTTVRRFLLGHSVQGRPIVAYEITGGTGPPQRTVLVVGCIHGNEPAGIPIARALVKARPPVATRLWVIPVLNPDGVAADTRQNADGVDLNRNFPWHWHPLGPSGSTFYAGPHALSEPESAIAARLILKVHPQISIWFHQRQDLVDLSGGDPRIERRFAALVGLPVTELTRFPGSVVSWENSQLPGSTAFVVELPAGELSDAGVRRYARAVLELARPPS